MSYTTLTGWTNGANHTTITGGTIAANTITGMTITGNCVTLGAVHTGGSTINMTPHKEVDHTSSIFLTELNGNNPYHRFHYEVWRKLHETAEHMFVSMLADVNGYSANRYLGFHDAGAFAEFNTWWEAYAARFNGKVMERKLPGPGNNAVYAAGSKGNHLVQDQWCWILENCEKPVTASGDGDYWLFESKEEKCAFSLKW